MFQSFVFTIYLTVLPVSYCKFPINTPRIIILNYKKKPCRHVTVIIELICLIYRVSAMVHVTVLMISVLIGNYLAWIVEVMDLAMKGKLVWLRVNFVRCGVAVKVVRSSYLLKKQVRKCSVMNGAAVLKNAMWYPASVNWRSLCFLLQLWN